MSVLVGAAACLCALSVFIVTGLERADACKIAQVCKCEALLVVAAARSVTDVLVTRLKGCLLYTSPSPRDSTSSRMPSSA